MALSIEDKKKIVSDVNDLANNASSLVLADARGLKVSEANELRSEGFIPAVLYGGKQDNLKINQPILKPKIEKSDEKVKDPAPEEEIVKSELVEKKSIVNMPVRKPIIKKKDNFDPLKIAELIDMAQDTKSIDDAKDEEYESLDSTDTLVDKLTLSEEDAIRSQFLRCWSIPIGMPEDDSLVVKVKISLRQDGSLMKPPEVTDHQRMNKPSEKYFKVLAESALRAVRRCDPIKTPSIERYEDWKTLQLNFDPREILR